jgi:hypothetical protein
MTATTEPEACEHGLFVEIAEVVADERTVIACAQQLLGGEPVPLLALAAIRTGEDGQPRSRPRPMLIWPKDLPVAEALIEHAIEAAPHAPRKTNEIHVLARDGELAVGLIRSRPRKGKKSPPSLAMLTWTDGAGMIVVELEHLPLLAVLLRQARAKLAEQGLDPTAPGSVH